MEKETFHDLECEANWHIPYHLYAQVKLDRSNRIRAIIENENMWELEAWQNAIFTQYVSRDNLPFNTTK